MHGVPLEDGFSLKFSEVRHASFDVIAFDDRVCSSVIKLLASRPRVQSGILYLKKSSSAIATVANFSGTRVFK